MKRILTLVFCLVLIVMNCMSVSATSNKDDKSDLNSYLASCFEKQEQVCVLDNDGIDITSEFFDANYVNYVKNDFAKIRTYMNQNVSTIILSQEMNNDTDGISPLALTRSKTISQTITRKLDPKVFTDFYAVYTVSGTIRFDPSTGLIKSVSSTKISNIYYEDKSPGVYVKERKVMRAGQIIDNGYVALFTGSIAFDFSVSADDTTVKETLGPYNVSLKGHAGDYY